ncbi:MAG: hypothetical protein ACT4PT_02885 [Methanobacteriota archaeon]
MRLVLLALSFFAITTAAAPIEAAVKPLLAECSVVLAGDCRWDGRGEGVVTDSCAIVAPGASCDEQE